MWSRGKVCVGQNIPVDDLITGTSANDLMVCN